MRPVIPFDTDVHGFIVLTHEDGTLSDNKLHITIDGERMTYCINGTCLLIPDPIAARWVELFLAALHQGGWATSESGGSGPCAPAPPDTYAESPRPWCSAPWPRATVFAQPD